MLQQKLHLKILVFFWLVIMEATYDFVVKKRNANKRKLHERSVESGRLKVITPTMYL